MQYAKALVSSIPAAEFKEIPLIPRPLQYGDLRVALLATMIFSTVPTARLLAADVVVLNANVITVDNAKPRAEAFAIEGDRFSHVGSNVEIKRKIKPDTKVIDLRGLTVVPGFNDGQAGRQLLRSRQSADEYGKQFKAYLAKGITSIQLKGIDPETMRALRAIPQEARQLRIHATLKNEFRDEFVKLKNEDALGDEYFRVGERRPEESLSNSGNAGGPASHAHPMLRIKHLVMRPSDDGTHVTVEQALAAWTLGSASASSEENIKGSITPGKLADFVVLSRDPHVVDDEELDLCLVLQTFVGGKLVFEQNERSAIQGFPLVDRVPLRTYAKLGRGPDKENSGIVKSRTQSDVFWMQNDSGDDPRVYPVHRDGTVYRSQRTSEKTGVMIGGAINVDWEDIAVDDEGHVIVADFGNNRNDRRDLVLYYINEPAAVAKNTVVKKKVFFRYPDQPSFPAPRTDFNYDAEALFTLNNRPYVLTKHRSDTKTKLFRLDRAEPFVTNELTFVDEFQIEGRVTAADTSPDGKHVVVGTYKALWLFDVPDGSDNIFEGRIRWFPYKSKQIESVCFADEKTLLLADEATAMLAEVSIDDFQLIRGPRGATAQTIINFADPKNVEAHRPIIVAHRGGVVTDESPECSLTAIRLAAEQGYDMVELDIQMSKDGEPIVFHDRTLEKACRKEGTVAERNSSQLTSIRYLSSDDYIVHLGTALEFCAQHKLGVMLDLKAGSDSAEFLGKVKRLLAKHHLTNSTVTFSGSETARRVLRGVVFTPTDAEMKSLRSGETIDLRHRFWFGLPSRLKTGDIERLKAAGALIIPAINTFRYPANGHFAGAKRDVERLTQEQVDGFQIDSIYYELFDNPKSEE